MEQEIKNKLKEEIKQEIIKVVEAYRISLIKQIREEIVERLKDENLNPVNDSNTCNPRGHDGGFDSAGYAILNLPSLQIKEEKEKAQEELKRKEEEVTDLPPCRRH